MFEDDEITQQREEASRLKQRQREDDVKSQMATQAVAVLFGIS